MFFRNVGPVVNLVHGIISHKIWLSSSYYNLDVYLKPSTRAPSWKRRERERPSLIDSDVSEEQAEVMGLHPFQLITCALRNKWRHTVA
jgi:hypothetical protein